MKTTVSAHVENVLTSAIETREITFSTDHAASSYGKPVTLLNGDLQDNDEFGDAPILVFGDWHVLNHVEVMRAWDGVA